MKNRWYKKIILAGYVMSQTAFASVCEPGNDARIWISPRVINAGDPVNVMAVSSSQNISNLILTSPNNEKYFLQATANSGQPWSLSAQISGLNGGNYQIEAQDKDSNSLGCRTVLNGNNSEKKQAQWNSDYEAFYSAWIERLFDSPIDGTLILPSLEPILRSSEHNFLYNYLGLNEDEELPANTDCADLPYFLRAYFAWKNGLLFSFRTCNRGTTNARPSCSAANITTDFVQNTPASLTTFKALSHRLLNSVQSGNMRTSAIDEESDFYPLSLRREALWPGTIFADPYGHVLMLVKWVAQTSSSQGGLFAVDAHPDYSVTQKRFWEGTFVFANSASAAPGFKAFRPIANNQKLLTNAQLPRYSKEQKSLTSENFYARMDKLINPEGLDAKQTYEGLLTALQEQLEVRVQAVENVEDYFRQGGTIIEMPDIPLQPEVIFETTGLWEEYSTPSRDIRMLNAIDVLLAFPNKIFFHPELFNLTAKAAQETRMQILQLQDQLTMQKKIEYLRSNGMPQELTIAEILARRTALEMGYNPNDCPEIRWGAAVGSEEYTSCTRHAPVKQINQMTKRREWFRAAQRPPR